MIELRPRQKKMVAEVRAILKGGKVTRVVMQAPCGFGKTVLGSYVTQSAALKGKRVMFLTHRDELAKQASRTMKGFGIDHGFVHSAYSARPHCLVQIAMIDTLRNRIERIQVPHILIVDECHHAVSKTWQMIINHYHSLGCVIIGMSATPQRLDGRPLNDMFDDMVMGPTVRELIDEGSLADFAYYAPPQVADLEGLKQKYGDIDQKEQGERMDCPEVFGDAIEHYKTIMPGKRAIAFHVNIKGSKNFAVQCVEAGIPALHVDGEMSPGERAAAIRSFEDGSTWILSNVSLFGEGFDVRACDGVILLRRTMSLSLFIQMCGRAMRPHESKEKAFILDHVMNVKMHGLPDNDHDWSLEGKKKRPGKKKEAEDDVKMVQCTSCYHCHEPAPACPQCGFEYPTKGRGEMEQVDGQLVEITAEVRAAMQEKQQARVAQAQASSVEEMVSKLGYKRERALLIVKARQEKQALRDGLRADLMAWHKDTGQTSGELFDIPLADLNSLKPAGLKDLRARFDEHRRTHQIAETVDFFREQAAERLPAPAPETVQF